MEKLDPRMGELQVDGFLQTLPDEQRRQLQELRAYIRSIVPGATEKISWGMPIFSYGKQLVGYSAFKHHCSFFVMSLRVMDELRDEMKGFIGSKATLHFTPDHPLPKELVKKIVEARLQELLEQRGKGKGALSA